MSAATSRPYSEDIDWDAPGSWPSTSAWPATPGESIEGTITRIAIDVNRFGREGLVVELNNDDTLRNCNTALWRALGALRVRKGDRIKVTRGQDLPKQPGQAYATTTWKVERLEPKATAKPKGKGAEVNEVPGW